MSNMLNKEFYDWDIKSRVGNSSLFGQFFKPDGFPIIIQAVTVEGLARDRGTKRCAMDGGQMIHQNGPCHPSLQDLNKLRAGLRVGHDAKPFEPVNARITWHITSELHPVTHQLVFVFIPNRGGSVNMPFPPRTVCHASFWWDTARFMAPLIPGHPRKMCSMFNVFQHILMGHGALHVYRFDVNCEGFWSCPAGLLGKFTHIKSCPKISLDISRNDFKIQLRAIRISTEISGKPYQNWLNTICPQKGPSKSSSLWSHSRSLWSNLKDQV